MDISDCPAKHPGPWLKSKDSPEQAQLRKELANAGKIVFASNRDGNWEIYVCNADGSGQKNLTNSPAWDVYPRWTPDGKIIFFSDRHALETWWHGVSMRSTGSGSKPSAPAEHPLGHH